MDIIVKKLFYFIAIALMAVSCSVLMSKESYMKKFDAFVKEVSEKHQTYSAKDWEKHAATYKKFSEVWYEKFKNDLTLKDEIAIKANQVKYNYYYALGQTGSSIKDLINSIDAKALKEQVQFYINNNMKSDLQTIYDEARKAGKEAESSLAEIFKELNIKIDDLKK